MGEGFDDDFALARAIAAAALSVDGVAGLSEDPALPATYGPGGIVHGVAIERAGGEPRAGIHLAAEYRPRESLHELAARVRRAALRAARGGVAKIDVTVHDVLVPAE